MNEAMTSLSDEEVVGRIRQGEAALFEVLMRRYNPRLYRVALSIVKNDAEAEDVMQQAYVSAYRHLDQFAERAKFSTWLTRIAVNEALRRVRARRPTTSLDEPDDKGTTTMDRLQSKDRDPEHELLSQGTAGLLEGGVTAMPDAFRQVFMLRAVEGLSTLETAECLGVNEDTVKTRFYRAKRHMRRYLAGHVAAATPTAFPFHARRCDRVVARVMAEIQDRSPAASSSARWMLQ